MESSDKVVETVIVGNYVEMESEGKPNNTDIKSKISNLFWHGGSAYDAWFSCASNQVLFRIPAKYKCATRNSRQVQVYF